ncbi:MAG: NTP transferase domain-containing protein [Candidatus Nanopelagicales bacterium]
MNRVGAIVVAGGRASRMGGRDKLALQVAGTAVLDRALSSVAHADAVVVVGPVRPTSTRVRWTRETPAGSGPVAAIAAGLRELEGNSAAASSAQPGTPKQYDAILVLAGDMPLVNTSFARLVEALESGPWDVAVAVDEQGVDQPLLSAWRTAALVAALQSVPRLAGARVRDLLTDIRINRVEVGVAALDCDEEADIQRAEDALKAQER